MPFPRCLALLLLLLATLRSTHEATREAALFTLPLLRLPLQAKLLPTRSLSDRASHLRHGHHGRHGRDGCDGDDGRDGRDGA